MLLEEITQVLLDEYPKGCPPFRIEVFVGPASLAQPVAPASVSYYPLSPAEVSQAGIAREEKYFREKYGPGLPIGYCLALLSVAATGLAAKPAEDGEKPVSQSGPVRFTITSEEFKPETGGLPALEVRIATYQGQRLPGALLTQMLYAVILSETASIEAGRMGIPADVLDSLLRDSGVSPAPEK